MDFDKRTIIAFLLIGLVLIFVQTPLYKKIFLPEAYKQEIAQKRALETAQTNPDSITVPPIKTAPEKNPDISASDAQSDPLQSTQRNVIPMETPSLVPDELPEKTIRVESEHYSAVFSSQGASLIEWVLKDYDGPNNQPLQMLPDDAYGTLGISFVNPSGDTIQTRNWSFTPDRQSDIVLSGNEEKRLLFRTTLDGNQVIEKEFIFKNQYYAFDMNVTLKNMGDMIADKSYFINAPAGLLPTEKRIEDDMYYAKAVVSAGEDVEKGYKPNGEWHTEKGTINWIAARTKYFMLAIIPREKRGSGANVYGEKIPITENREEWKKFNIQLVMPYLNNRLEQQQFTVYFGPLDVDVLKAYQVNLEKAMDFGAKILQPFSYAILWTFKFIHNFIPNYGIVIIIFSFLIKILVYPLTHKSYVSMKKMQSLSPKLNELREKYGKDPQRMNKETMKLYKEQGVNPLGGCLPMLLQMPLLWGLFIVFRSTIELRGEGFLLWINDLSAPDTIATLPFSIPLYGDMVNILPLIMGATMLLQQKMTTTDPKQKAMVYLMPIFLTLLFNRFPSGLNLYYALFNILSILQQKYLIKDPGEEKKEVKKKRL
ncbi:membrane protein insertase YidC [candidate division KSB1 bacterium]|nr:membrane protein insertase YidC [candidate division KSB1 bacterium]